MLQLPDIIYEEAVARGTKLLEEINKPPDSTTSSVWKKYSDIEENGWHSTCHRKDSITGLTGVKEIANEYGIDISEAANVKICWTHAPARDFDPNLMEGEYCQYFNTDGGTILATGLRSPLAMGEPCASLSLSHWSDVTYLQWANLTSIPESLDWVIHCSISNQETAHIIDRVLAGQEGGKSQEKGILQRKLVEEEDGDDFKALLGSPNGLGTAWMLAQHKGLDQLGWKRVESISLFSAGMSNLMMIEIGDHLEEEDMDVVDDAA